MEHTRIIPVFISSTFKDMQGERDYISYFVFPRLNDALKRSHVQVACVDLRAGINTDDMDEATIETKVLDVCMGEIHRAKPFFIGLLGNRYGWVPGETLINYKEESRSITEMEIYSGFFLNKDSSEFVFLERSPEIYEQLDKRHRTEFDDAVSEDELARKNYRKLARLKTKIKEEINRRGLSDRYKTYTATWNGSSMDGLEEFGDQIYNTLLCEIRKYVKDIPADAPQTVIEDAQNEALVESLCQNVYYREVPTRNILQKVLQEGVSLVLTGETGCGKTCQYAMLVQELKKRTDIITLYHSTSCSIVSQDIKLMLQRWIRQLENVLNVPQTDTSSYSEEEMTTAYQSIIKNISRQRKVVMLIDGVDAFKECKTARYMTFFSRGRNENVTIIATASSDYVQPLLHYNRLISEWSIPPFDIEDAKSVINLQERLSQKELHQDVINALLSKRGTKGYCYQSPLWLELAIRIVCLMNRQDFIRLYQKEHFSIKELQQERIATMSEDISLLFEVYLQQLTSVYGDIVMKTMGWICHSLSGLSEDTLAHLYGPSWKALDFAYVRAYLSPFLMENQWNHVWRFTHAGLNTSLQQIEMDYRSVAKYYWHLYAANKTVTDNILYYLFMANATDGFRHYFLKCRAKRDNRLISECILLTSLLDSDKLLYEYIHAGVCEGWKTRFIRGLVLCEMTMPVIKEFMRIGKYREGAWWANQCISMLNKLSLPKIIDVSLVAQLEHLKLECNEELLSDEEMVSEYERVIARLNGGYSPLARLFSFFSRRVYRWRITKLKMK